MRQAIIWTNAGVLLIGTSGTNFGEILSEIHTFSFKTMHLKMSSAKWWKFVATSMCWPAPSTGRDYSDFFDIVLGSLASKRHRCCEIPHVGYIVRVLKKPYYIYPTGDYSMLAGEIYHQTLGKISIWIGLLLNCTNKHSGIFLSRVIACVNW